VIACATKDAKIVEESSPEASVIHSVEADHVFSSSSTQDKFRLILTGKNVLNGTVEFQILKSSGESIYKIDFESRALLNYGLKANATDEEKSKYILNRMNDFFIGKNFVDPAINSSEAYDKDYNVISESQWSEIKNGNTIGFYYILWEGDQSWTAFSKSENKVVRYRKCC
jgi:hypothetical protein